MAITTDLGNGGFVVAGAISTCRDLHDHLHRTDGPAIEWADERKSWYLNGEEVIEEQFNNKLYRTLFWGDPI